MGDVQSLVLQVWLPAGSQAIDQVAHPPGFSGVGAQAADLGAHQPGLQVCWGFLSSVHSPGPEGVGVQEATTAVENSLNSR